MFPKVILESWEIELAAIAGVQRQVENLAKNRTPKYGAGRWLDWQLAIDGCLGECALAKYLGIFWSGKGRFAGLDVGRYQVRTSQTGPDLLLHPDDQDNHIFWLVVGLNGEYEIRGWIEARIGKDKKYWRDPVGGRGCYFVPQAVLISPTIDP